MRGVNLRINANVISPTSFQNRKAFLVQAYKDGAFLADPESRGKARPNPMTDPAAMEGMMGMMKNNVAMMVPQTLIMGWINAFFSGFVICMWLHINPEAGLAGHNLPCQAGERCLCLLPVVLLRRDYADGILAVKLPFPLTPQFKSMLQSGVGTYDLDARWVSSLSWYFLTFFGLQPVYNFILGSNNCKKPPHDTIIDISN